MSVGNNVQYKLNNDQTLVQDAVQFCGLAPEMHSNLYVFKYMY